MSLRQRPASRLLGNSVWNVVGTAAPALVAIPSMGWLARAMGAERFGLLTLAWALVGYFAVMDLGVARSVCWLVAQHPTDRDRHAAILGTSLVIGGAVSAFAGLVVLVLAAKVPQWLSVSSAVASDAVAGARVLVITLPLLVLTTILQGVQEGLQQFRDVSLQRMLVGLLIWFAPVAAVLVTPTFESAVWGLAVARGAGCALAYRRMRRATGLRARFEFGTVVRIVRFGGWIAVSNFIYPIMSYLDRFWLSNAVGVARVGTYAAPSELIGRATSLPVAISRALFPAISDAASTREIRAAVVRRGILLTLGSCGPVAAALVAFGPSLTSAWLGTEVGPGAGEILRVLAVGFLSSALAQIPFSILQATGNSRATALVHAGEVVPYVVLLLLLGPRFGPLGVAWAWTVRVTVDAGVLAVLASRAMRPTTASTVDQAAPNASSVATK